MEFLYHSAGVTVCDEAIFPVLVKAVLIGGQRRQPANHIEDFIVCTWDWIISRMAAGKLSKLVIS